MEERVGKKLLKAAASIILSLLGLVIALVAAGFGYRAYRHNQIARSTEINVTNGVDEAFFVKIGGIDQWISIRGQNRDNPVLLFLHGGPGVATSPYPRTMLFNWTRDFTFVQWDQRGAGKTFGKSGPLDSGVTIDRMAMDGNEVAEFLLQRLHKQKIVLLGLSWGSCVGIHMARKRPDLFYAYVGTGQMVSEREGEQMDYAQVLDKARARDDRKAIRDLQAIGPPPYDSQAKLGVQRKWALAYEPGGLSLSRLAPMILFESDANFHDLRDYFAGVTDSQDYFFGLDMSGPLASVDLRKLGADFGVPIFIFQGAEDDIAPARLAREYLDMIAAPRKQFVAISGAGHTAMYMKSDEFLRLLDQQVRPLANP